MERGRRVYVRGGWGLPQEKSHLKRRTSGLVQITWGMEGWMNDKSVWESLVYSMPSVSITHYWESYWRITTHRTWGYDRLHSQHVWATWKHLSEADTQQWQCAVTFPTSFTRSLFTNHITKHDISKFTRVRIFCCFLSSALFGDISVPSDSK